MKYLPILFTGRGRRFEQYRDIYYDAPRRLYPLLFLSINIIYAEREFFTFCEYVARLS